jgi:hypothetical protein
METTPTEKATKLKKRVHDNDDNNMSEYFSASSSTPKKNKKMTPIQTRKLPQKKLLKIANRSLYTQNLKKFDDQVSELEESCDLVRLNEIF